MRITLTMKLFIVNNVFTTLFDSIIEFSCFKEKLSQNIEVVLMLQIYMNILVTIVRWRDDINSYEMKNVWNNLIYS